MANYVFENITAAQAQSYVASTDSLTFTDTAVGGSTIVVTPQITTVAPDPVTGGGGSTLTGVVLYDPFDGVSKTFGPGIQTESTFLFNDGSTLFVGSNAGGDSFDAGANNATGNDGLYGFGGADSLSGGSGADVILGNAGDDTLVGGAGSDTLYGGAGNDSIDASTGTQSKDHDLVNGNKGDDTIVGSNTGNTLFGGQGNDNITGGTGADSISGDLGDDTIVGGYGNDTLLGGSGADSINEAYAVAGTYTGIIHGDDGNDSISTSGDHGNGGLDVNGNAGNDYLNVADAGASTYHGGAGDDTIVGAQTGSVAQQFWGDLGNDSIDTSTSTNDTIQGGAGDDTIYAHGGAAHSGVLSIDAGSGNDTVTIDHSQTESTAGNDTVLLGDGDDKLTIHGAYGQESVDAGNGNDSITITTTASTGNDTFLGGSGDDTIDAHLHNTGHESLDGGAGNDKLFAGTGGDTLNAGDGADTLYGNTGLDHFFGGTGNDVFSFGNNQSNFSVGSQDQIHDWEGGTSASPVDHLTFGIGTAGTASGAYIEQTATDYASATSFANTQFTAGYKYVAVQVGGDVVVFANTHTGVGFNGLDSQDDAVVLVGRSLTDIDGSNIT